MSRVLVTGGTGFIGRQLVEHLLARGDRVVCLARSPEKAAALEDLGAEIALGDVNDAECLRRAAADTKTVYHLAGAVMVIDRKDFYRVNETGAANIVKACAAQPTPPVLVFASSLAAAGISPNDHARIEEDPETPISAYGRSKLAAEKRLREYAGEVPITIVRPPMVFGPGDKHMLRAFRSIKNGWHVAPGASGAHYSLIYVQDLAEMLVKAAEGGRRVPAPSVTDSDHSGVYYAASPEQPTYFELGAKMARAMGGKRFRSVGIPKPLCFALSGVVEVLMRLEGRARLLNFDKMRDATAAGSWICSAARAARELGFRPTHSLDERLEQTARWYSAHVGL